jgi:hypothetical protein
VMGRMGTYEWSSDERATGPTGGRTGGRERNGSKVERAAGRIDGRPDGLTGGREGVPTDDGGGGRTSERTPSKWVGFREERRCIHPQVLFAQAFFTFNSCRRLSTGCQKQWEDSLSSPLVCSQEKRCKQ